VVLDYPAASSEEDEIEREAHAEGVDAAAAGDQQAGPRALATEDSEPQQPAGERGGDRDVEAEQPDPIHALEATRS
jgi:hypothetical protein